MQKDDKKIEDMTDEDWKNKLTPEQYKVCREKGTELPFSGQYYYSKEKGVYKCVCCGAELFKSDTKFDSGTGWPSFYQPFDPAHIAELVDRSHGMTRTEIRCKRCDGHLGHVFPDGPPPTYQRYCLNSASMQFYPEGETPAQHSRD